MSLKVQAKFVEDSLSADEKVLESAFKLERLYKKYKFIIWGVVALIIIYFGASAIYSWHRNNQLQEANNAYLTLEQNPKDSSALETLKKDNPKLYELLRYKQSIKSGNESELKKLSSIPDTLITDIAKYHAAVLKSKVVDSQYYHDMSLLEGASQDLKDGKIDSAKNKLSLISESSPAAGVAKLLRHYTLTSK